MEAFTSGKVSAAARKAYLESHPNADASWFTRIRNGYKMYGWESQIDMARALGRGTHSGKGIDAHPFDRNANLGRW